MQVPDGRSQPYSPSATYSWTPASNAAGNHAVQVWVRNAGSSAALETWAGTGLFGAVAEPLSTAVLTADMVFPVPSGTPIKWTTRVNGGIAPLQYQFWVFRQGSGWSLARDYSPSNTMTWIPPGDGSYVIQGFVRNAGSTATYDTWTTSGFFGIQSGSPARIARFSADHGFPALTGSTVTWTAAGNGGNAGPLQFKFFRFNSRTNAWTLVQDWSASNTFSWTPTASDSGVYALQVWVRSAGSTAAFEGWSGTGFFSVQ